MLDILGKVLKRESDNVLEEVRVVGVDLNHIVGKR